MTHSTSPTAAEAIGFIGGGNMASAVIGGLLQGGLSPTAIEVVEPWAEARDRLATQFGLTPMAAASPTLARCGLIVWAVKPQTFREAADAVRPHTQGALHLSVAAGIRSDTIAAWLGSQRIVRSMPNTPALVGLGMTGLFARDGVSAADRQRVEQVLRPTGALLWLDAESQLDAVTALSGSGPAYVFYFLEAMTRAGIAHGLSREQAHRLAVGTFTGAAQLAQQSDEPPELLRQRVTSKGGTTHAAITAMEADGVGPAIERAIGAAATRARELGEAFGH